MNVNLIAVFGSLVLAFGLFVNFLSSPIIIGGSITLFLVGIMGFFYLKPTGENRISQHGQSL